MHGLSSASMKVDSEGEQDSQRKGTRALSSESIQHRTGTEADVGHRNHLRNQMKEVDIAISWSCQLSLQQLGNKSESHTDKRLISLSRVNVSFLKILVQQFLALFNKNDLKSFCTDLVLKQFKVSAS